MAGKNHRPNILWICTDQQRVDATGALGNPYIRTPNLDQLAATGVAFDCAYCRSLPRREGRSAAGLSLEARRSEKG